MATMRNLPDHFATLRASRFLRGMWFLPREALILLVTGYQKTLSPDHGPLKALWTYGYCRHEPTCSEYAKDALRRRGAVLGAALSIGRVLTCHPWKKLSEEKILKISGMNH